MLSEEEKNEIINKAVEKTMLLIPEVIGNVMTNHAALLKMNKKFYEEHPEFVPYKHIVQFVVEDIEGKNPAFSYEDILKEAVPEIRRRILVSKDVDVKSVVGSIPRNYSGVDLSNNGSL